MARRGNPKMLKGGPSLNPSGRPPGAAGMARYIGSISNGGHDIADRLMRIVNEGSDRDATAASTILLGYQIGRPMSYSELHVVSNVDVRVLMALAPEARLAALDHVRARRALGASPDPDDTDAEDAAYGDTLDEDEQS